MTKRDAAANKFAKSRRFQRWLDAMPSDVRHKIKARIVRAESGNFGDCISVGEGIFEMRVHTGPGYRLYYYQRGHQFYFLLIGGDKRTQASDIELAKRMKRRIERSEQC